MEVCLRTLKEGRDLVQAALSLKMGDLLPHLPPTIVLVVLEGQVGCDVMHPSVQECVLLIGTRSWYFCNL